MAWVPRLPIKVLRSYRAVKWRLRRSKVRGQSYLGPCIALHFI